VTAAPRSRRAYAPRLPPEQRRDQLLDVALGLALTGGFGAVTIDAVARHAGVTRPVVYGVFADRAALTHALLEREQARALDQLAAALPRVPPPGSDIDPDALLVRGLEAYLSAISTHPDTWRMVLFPPEGAPPELRASIAAGRRVSLARLRELTDWGLHGRGLPGVDPDLFARAVLTLSEGAGRMVLADPERYPVETFTGFTRALLAALRPGA
jgi:AcrR family transcriptional regulator